jgi:hypothetical protein
MIYLAIPLFLVDQWNDLEEGAIWINIVGAIQWRAHVIDERLGYY